MKKLKQIYDAIPTTYLVITVTVMTVYSFSIIVSEIVLHNIK